MAQPDVVAFQDVLTGPGGQDAAIVEALRGADAGAASSSAAPAYALFACATVMHHMARLCVPCKRFCSCMRRAACAESARPRLLQRRRGGGGVPDGDVRAAALPVRSTRLRKAPALHSPRSRVCCRRWPRQLLASLPTAFASAREAAPLDVWPLQGVARTLQAPFFGNSVAVRGGAGATV